MVPHGRRCTVPGRTAVGDGAGSAAGRRTMSCAVTNSDATGIVEGRRYQTGEPVRVVCAGPVIERVEPIFTRESPDGWPWVAPGLFDLQVNGYGGRWFASATLTVDDVRQIVQQFLRRGVTRLLPTLVTGPTEALEHGLRVIRSACQRDPEVRAAIQGCHLEGPFISAEDGPRGAHAREHVRPASIEEFERLQRAAEGEIRLLTLAPEVPGAIELIRHATRRGVTVAIGHTAAGAEDIRAAVEAGARLSTHLGNGAHAVLPRHPNYIWEQLAEPRLWASVIGDGFHLPGSVVRCIVAVKGRLRTILTCDAAGLAGVAPGVYRTPAGDCEVLQDGRIVVAGQRTLLAGSALTTEQCVVRTAAMTGFDAGEVWEMASRNPARLLRLPEHALRRGHPARLVRYFVEEPPASTASVDGGAIRRWPVLRIDGVWFDGRRVV
ncbi:MAG: N-acetylglucosamine-6-phosphate deacetylase [Planctomycetota bacterium]|nr:MAG: N-acetylglucosamine-6-phosphate deacetylase [Planctomycetota bacterium]